MATLDHAGLAGTDPLAAVPCVENHDTDSSPNLGPIVHNRALAYADIRGSEGYPCAFYRDYSCDAGCYGMRGVIDDLMWIHERLSTGTNPHPAVRNTVRRRRKAVRLACHVRSPATARRRGRPAGGATVG